MRTYPPWGVEASFLNLSCAMLLKGKVKNFDSNLFNLSSMNRVCKSIVFSSNRFNSDILGLSLSDKNSSRECQGNFIFLPLHNQSGIAAPLFFRNRIRSE